MINQDEARQVWENAIASVYGIAVQTDNRRVLISELYHYRARHGTDETYQFQIALPMEEDWIWIHRKGLKQPKLRMMERADFERLSE